MRPWSTLVIFSEKKKQSTLNKELCIDLQYLYCLNTGESAKVIQNKIYGIPQTSELGGSLHLYTYYNTFVYL